MDGGDVVALGSWLANVCGWAPAGGLVPDNDKRGERTA